MLGKLSYEAVWLSLKRWMVGTMRDPIRLLAQFGVHCLTTLALSVERVSAHRKSLRVSEEQLVSLRSARLIYVLTTPFALQESVIKELSKRSEFQRLGLMITRDLTNADLKLNLRPHKLLDLYLYSAVDRRTDLPLASGKVTSFTGSVAKKVARRFMKQMVKARAGLSQWG